MAAAAATSATSADIIEAYRHAWETFAKEEVAEIRKMSSEEYQKSVDRLLIKAWGEGNPESVIKSLVEYPGGMTERECVLRRHMFIFHFTPLSEDELQSHFTHFYKKRRIITNLLSEVDDKAKKEELECAKKATAILIDEIGRSILKKGSHPVVPSFAG